MSEVDTKVSFPKAIAQTLAYEMARDENVFVMGEDIGHYGGMFKCTEGLLDQFSELRVIDTPISESGFVGMALGAAMMGKRPVVELMFVDFALVAMDQILNQTAKTHLMTGGRVQAPLVIRTQGGGYKGGAAQHSQMLEAMFLHLPGLKVVCPSSPRTAKGLLLSAIRDNAPVVFIEHKQFYGMSGEVPDGEYLIPIGKGEVARSGSDISIFTYSFGVTQCLEAASKLEQEGIDCEVIDLLSLNPIDFDLVAQSVSKTHRAMVVQEAHARCGFGSDLGFQIQSQLFDELDAPVGLVAAANIPIPFAKNLEDAVLPSPAKIESAVRELVGR